MWDIIKVNASTKFWVCTSNVSAMTALTDRHTHKQTGPISYPWSLTRDGMKRVQTGWIFLSLNVILLYWRTKQYEKVWALTALPRRALFVSILVQRCHDVTPWRHVTSWRHTVRSHDIIIMSWQSEPAQINPSENPKITFFNLATLSFDLWPWPSNLSEILSRSTPPPNFWSVCQTVRLWESWQTHTHAYTQTDGTDFIPLTADAGGNK